MNTLIRYATEIEINNLRTAFRLTVEAQGELNRINRAIGKVEIDLNTFSRQSHLTAADAARRALGEPTAGSLASIAPPIDRAELQAQLTGLNTRKHEAFMNVQWAEGKFRDEKLALIRACAERAAEDYVKHAKWIEWCWEGIAAAEQLAGGLHSPVAPYTDWSTFHIPGGHSLPALKKATREEWSRPVVASGEHSGQRIKVTADRVEAEIQQLMSPVPQVLQAAG